MRGRPWVSTQGDRAADLQLRHTFWGAQPGPRSIWPLEGKGCAHHCLPGLSETFNIKIQMLMCKQMSPNFWRRLNLLKVRKCLLRDGDIVKLTGFWSFLATYKTMAHLTTVDLGFEEIR